MLQDQIQSENLNELFSALSKAQGVLENAKKESKNPFFKSNYADLSSVLNTCREVLSSHGLSVVQTIHRDETGHFLMSTLGHSSGQWIRSFYPLVYSPTAKDLNQALGSAVTYGRRYALAALVGISQEDDDGEGCALKKDKEQPQKYTPPQEQNKLDKPISPNQVAVLSSLLKDEEEIKSFILKSVDVQRIEDFPAKKFEGVLIYIKNEVDKREKQKCA